MGFWDILYAAGGILFSSLGGAAIVLALSSWLGKVWANRILESDRKRYNSELEALKNRFERGRFIHRLQFEAEFETYLELWSKVVAVMDDSLRLRPVLDYRPSDRTQDEEKRERLNNLAASHRDYQECFRRREPFIAPHVFDSCKKLADKALEEGIAYKHGDGGRFSEYWDEAKKNADDIKELAEGICVAVRERIQILETSS